MRAHIEAWANRVWEKHHGGDAGGNGAAARQQNICDAVAGVQKAYAKRGEVNELTANLRDKKVKDNIAPLFEQALKKKLGS